VPPMPEERQRKGGLVSVMQEKAILCAMHTTMVCQLTPILFPTDWIAHLYFFLVM
jgi:hypothetical protein